MTVVPLITIGSVAAAISPSSAEPSVLVVKVTSYGASASPTVTANVAPEPSSTVTFPIVICGLSSSFDGGIPGASGSSPSGPVPSSVIVPVAPSAAVILPVCPVISNVSGPSYVSSVVVATAILSPVASAGTVTAEPLNVSVSPSFVPPITVTVIPSV